MYEATVSVPLSDAHLLRHVKEQICPPLLQMDGIATDLVDKHRCYFSVACSDTFRFQLKRLLTDSISEVVALGYKNLFMRDFLHVSHGDFFQNVLINTVCVFDKAYDRQIISKVLDVDKPIYIDGYCNFRLQVLKQKWREIAKLVLQNNYIMYDEQLILEFLQYLLESLSTKVTNLTLTFEADTFLLYDSHNSVLPNVNSLAPNVTVEEEAALNVLLLKPKHLTVYHSAKPSAQFCRLINMFDCKFVSVR